MNPKGLFRTYSPSIRVVLVAGRAGELLQAWAKSAAIADLEM